MRIKAYGGLLRVTKKQYTLWQSIVFVILGGLLIASYMYNLDQFLFGQARIVILGVAILEVIEMIYIFHKFKDQV